MNRASSPRAAFEDAMLLFARFAFLLVFLPGGWRKLWNFSGFAEGLEPRGLPFGLPLPLPELWAAAAVAIEVVAPLMLLFGVGTRWAALLLVAFVLMANLTSHRFWEFEEAAEHARHWSAFVRNLAYMGGLFALSMTGPGRISVEYWWRAAQRKQVQA
jgi:putative oxidoreductase